MTSQQQADALLSEHQAGRAALQRIERYAMHATYEANSIVQNIRQLPARPDFETRAEDELRKAERNLSEALATVRQSLAEYSEKPVTA